MGVGERNNTVWKCALILELILLSSTVFGGLVAVTDVISHWQSFRFSFPRVNKTRFTQTRHGTVVLYMESASRVL